MLKRFYLTLIKLILNKISPSFCLAKWLQGTLHLQTGLVHCCHHPIPHKIPLDRLGLDSSLLLNTPELLIARAQMRRGIRPKECSYCWSIEDSSPETFSDRVMKSAQPWALRDLRKILIKKKSEHQIPKYLEVSFSNFCNMNCLYCTPENSSSILDDVNKRGPYPLDPPLFDFDNLKRAQAIPIVGPNPYSEAFFHWLPELQKSLRTLRLTGGEPFLQRELDELFNQLQAPHLKLAINTNLNFSTEYFQRKLSHLDTLLQESRLGCVELFVSVDTIGEKGTYIRQGLQEELLWNNIDYYLSRNPTQLTLLCTFCALTVFNFKDFLLKITQLRQKYPRTKIILGLSALRHPEHLSARLIPESMWPNMDQLYVTMKELKFSPLEVNHLKRIIDWVKHTQGPELENHRKNFFLHLREKDRRFGSDYKKTFPEMNDWSNQET